MINSVFRYIDVLYPFVDSIIAADDLAFGQDPTYGSTYYAALWSELDSITITSINSAIIDLASVWQTAWEDAGKPSPPGVSIDVKTGFQPNEYELSQNYPNPFNPITTINYSLTRHSEVQLSIYDLLGKEIVQLFNGSQDAGDHSINWNATNFSSGIYFYRFKVGTSEGDFIQTRKMVLLK